LSMSFKVNLKINGKEYNIEVPAHERLIDTLRYRLGFTSVKEGCGRGECGTCIVLVNGLPRHSCLTLTAALNGDEVTTLEGLAPEGKLHAIQLAFIETRGVQCGFCTPGFIMMTKALLDAHPEPKQEQVREWLSSVLCRCGSYHYYFAAAKLAAKYIKEGKIYFDEKQVREKYHLRVVGR